MKTAMAKTDFIKFNVSPRFKALAVKKARSAGMSLSELGRMLFGAYVQGLISHEPKVDLIKLAEQAKKEYKEGKLKTFSSYEDISKHLDSLAT